MATPAAPASLEERRKAALERIERAGPLTLQAYRARLISYLKHYSAAEDGAHVGYSRETRAAIFIELAKQLDHFDEAIAQIEPATQPRAMEAEQ